LKRGAFAVTIERMPLPSGPSSSVEAQTFAWYSRPHSFLAECAAEYGDCFTIHVQGWGDQVVVSHPDAVREVFTADAEVLHGGKGNHFLLPLFRQGSLFVLDGEHHRRQRKLLMPAFHGSALRGYSRAIADTARALCRTWPADRPVPMHDKLLELAMEIILLVMFGIREEEARYHPVKRQLALLARTVRTSVASASAEAASAAAVHFARVRGDLDALLIEEVAHRRERPDPTRHDVLALLMESRDEAGLPLSDEELRDEMVTLLSAGHDTVATTLAWAVLALDEHPEVRAHVLQEVDALGPEPDPDALARLPYLGAVVDEVMRLHPVVPAVSRQVMKPFRVAGHDLEPGARVTAAVYLAHRRAEAFPAPDRFRPERFLERVPSPFEFFPFGGGVRRCIGLAFSLHQMRIVLGTILSEVELRGAMRGPTREVRHGLLVAPSEGARMTARRRESVSRSNGNDQGCAPDQGGSARPAWNRASGDPPKNDTIDQEGTCRTRS